MMLGVTSFAQENDTKKTIKEAKELVAETGETGQEAVATAERIIDKYSGKAYEAVKEIAEALAVPAEHLYGVLVKQSIVDAIVYLLVLIMGGILIYLFCVFCMKVKCWEYIRDKDDNELFPLFLVHVLLVIFGFIMLIIGLTSLTDIVQGFINPEYKAIQTIIETLK